MAIKIDPPEPDSPDARILRREAELVGLTRDYVIYDSDDQRALMKRVFEDLGVDPEKIQPELV